MNKLAIIVAVAFGICLFGVSQAQAAATDTLAITVTLQSLSVSITAGTEPWAIGSVVAESATESGTYTVTNDGNIIEDIAIVCGNSADWTVGAAAGVDVFKMEAKGGEKVSYTSIAASETIKSSLAVSGTVEDLQLQFTAPSVGSVITEQSITVTLTVTASAS